MTHEVYTGHWCRAPSEGEDTVDDDLTLLTQQLETMGLRSGNRRLRQGGLDIPTTVHTRDTHTIDVRLIHSEVSVVRQNAIIHHVIQSTADHFELSSGRRVDSSAYAIGLPHELAVFNTHTVTLNACMGRMHVSLVMVLRAAEPLTTLALGTGSLLAYWLLRLSLNAWPSSA